MTQKAQEPIAIVGVGCKLPGGITSPEGLVAALRNGRDCISEVPPERWTHEEYYDPDPVAPGKTYTRHGGFVSDIDLFDAGFFGISNAEADRMDPQQRMLLETVWRALEHAGQSPQELAQSNTGFFLGMMGINDYAWLKQRWEGIQGITALDAVADAVSIAAGRIAHFFGLEGPTFALDTACSSSLVAVHLACQSIRTGECDTAIVAGVNAILHPHVNIAFSKVGLLSREGRCKSFDARADGYIRGEGCVAVVLRRESSALARRDPILASILGSAINQDGRTLALTAPNGRAQENVVRRALSQAGVEATEIGYVEAHGTGTPVGDPIEMNSLVSVFGSGRSQGEPLYIGSIKSNMGHLEAAAGALGLVKAALSLDEEQIFPSLHFNRLALGVDLHGAPLRVPTTTIPWRRGRRPRIAGVNSFGYSGTNAHVIIREAPVAGDGDNPDVESSVASTRSYQMVTVSAKSSGSLNELVDGWVDFLERNDSSLLGDIALTALAGRSHLNHRIAVTGRSREEVAKRLRAWRDGREPKGLAMGRATKRQNKIAFVFTGQGVQYAGMGRGLYEAEPRFREALDQCAAIVQSECQLPLLDVLFGKQSGELLESTRNAQPALFSLGYALAQLLRYWGIEPEVVIGHSVGEITAAAVAGVIGLREALTFVAVRGALMGDLPRDGKMVSLDATPEEVRQWIEGAEFGVSIAGVNGPRSVVVSGASAVVDQIARRATDAGRRAKPLTVSHAFHSPLMDPILGNLREAAATLGQASPTLRVVSNVTGAFMPEEGVPAEYWVTHARQAVLFYEGMKSVVEAGCTIFVEIGPHPALIQVMSAAFDMSKSLCVPTLVRDANDEASLMDSLGALYTRGAVANAEGLFEAGAFRRTRIPNYVFQRDRHWLEIDQAAGQEQADSGLHPILGRRVGKGTSPAVFESRLSTTSPWVDHRVHGAVVFPASGYVEMIARGFAASKGMESCPLALRDVSFDQPLLLEYGKARPVTLTLEQGSNGDDGAASFSVSCVMNGRATRHCRGKVASEEPVADRVSIEALQIGMDTKIPIAPFYVELRDRGLDYGAMFSCVRELWIGKPSSGEALGLVQAAAHDNGAEPHSFVTSTLLDGCLQVTAAALETVGGAKRYAGTFVPARIENLSIRGPLATRVWSHATVFTNGDDRSVMVRVRVLSDDGEVLVDVNTLQMRQKEAPADRPTRAPVDTKVNSREQLLESLRQAPKANHIGVVIQWLAAEVKDTFIGQSEDFEDFDPSTGFIELGMDSLLMTDLLRRLQEKLEFRFPALEEGLDHIESIESLSKYLLDKVLVVEESPVTSTQPARQSEARA